MDNNQVIDLDVRIVDDLRNYIICQKSDDVKDLSISLSDKLVPNLGKFLDENVLDDTINEKLLEALHAGELKTKLTATNYDNYNSTKLNRKIASKNKKAATA